MKTVGRLEEGPIVAIDASNAMAGQHSGPNAHAVAEAIAAGWRVCFVRGCRLKLWWVAGGSRVFPDDPCRSLPMRLPQAACVTSIGPIY